MTGAGGSGDLLQQAVAAHNAGQVEVALQLYQQLLALQPANPQVLTLLATLLHQQGNVAQAVRTFHLALEINPQYPDAYNNLSCLLREQAQLDDALLCLDAACRLRPDYVDAHNNRAAVLCDLDRPAEALQAVDTALALQADSLAGHFNRGNALKELGRLEDAANEYRWCLQQSPEFAKATGNLAIVEKQASTKHHNGIVSSKILNIFRFEERYLNLFAVIVQCNVGFLSRKRIHNENASRGYPVFINGNRKDYQHQNTPYNDSCFPCIHPVNH